MSSVNYLQLSGLSEITSENLHLMKNVWGGEVYFQNEELSLRRMILTE